MPVEIFGHTFSNDSLLQQALTHRSSDGQCNNERLEFLGDALLGMIVAEVLFQRPDNFNEGDLTRIRAALVRRESLATIAEEHNLGKLIKLGTHENRHGNWQHSSVLADAVEAVIGAIYLDAGFAVCRQCVLRLFASRIDEIHDADVFKDAKTRLQEYMQAMGRSLPLYRVIKSEGAAHDRIFVVAGIVDTDPIVECTAQASSRRKAEQLVATQILHKLGVNVPG